MIIAKENYLTEACSIGDDRYRFDKFSVGVHEGASIATLFNSGSNIFAAVTAKSYQGSVKSVRQHIDNVIDKLETETEIMHNYLSIALKSEYSEKEFKTYIRNRDKAYDRYMMKDNDYLLQSARAIAQPGFVDAYKASDKLAKDFDELVVDIEKKFIKSMDKISKKINDNYSDIEKLIKVDGYPEDKVNWMRQEYNALLNSFKDLANDLNAIYSIAGKIEGVNESTISNGILTEGLFGSSDVPSEFKKFAIDFYTKINKVKPLKKQDFKSIINEKNKNHYSFEIDDPRNNFGKAVNSSAMKGAIFGAYSQFVNDAKINENKERKDLYEIIEKAGIKMKTSAKFYDNDRYIFSKDKEYIFKAWPAVAVEGNYFSTYAICLACEKYTDKLKDKLKLESSVVVSNEFDPTTYFSFQDEDKVCPGLFDDEKVFYRDPVYNKAITEYFDMTDRKTCRTLTHLNEAGQNTVLMNLTSKLYDKIVAKCDDIDYGEIPATKGDITKLSKYNDMKETISIMHDILKEYKQDAGPIDELSVALSNVEARKDLFERAYRYNCELPIAMYCNVTLGIITGISYMIATCIEFIKDPGTNTFRVALDKMAYAKTKDHMIYNTLKSFNKSCANKDFDKAMEAVLKVGTKNFAGSVAIGGIAIGVIGSILFLIPVLRELIFLFYYSRMRISDFFDIQADLLQANAYSLESNSTLDVDEQKKIATKQLKTVERFRKISNTFAIDIKKAEASSTKEKLQDDESKMLIDDIDSIDSSSGSALF